MTQLEGLQRQLAERDQRIASLENELCQFKKDREAFTKRKVKQYRARIRSMKRSMQSAQAMLTKSLLNGGTNGVNAKEPM